MDYNQDELFTFHCEKRHFEPQITHSAWLVEQIPSQWLKPLQNYWNSESFFKLSEFLANEYTNHEVFPHKANIFNALKYSSPVHQYLDPLDWPVSTVLNTPRVVIIGQDPYHGIYYSGETASDAHPLANGYAFSVHRGAPVPPSLENIYRELSRDPLVRFSAPNHGDLSGWAKQSVLLLNSSLTVRMGRAASHSGKGWEAFTDQIIDTINDSCTNIVFMLWGQHAQKKCSRIDRKKHLVLTATHPSPQAGDKFQGCCNFSKANDYLRKNKRQEIDWNAINY